MKRTILNLASIPCDLLDGSRKDDCHAPILAADQRIYSPPIYVIGENGKNVTKVSAHPHIPPTKGSVITFFAFFFPFKIQIWRR